MSDDAQQIAERLGHFTIGFLQIGRSNNGETVYCAGSGTLVDLHGVRGVLTAAHVLRALPAHGLVGLVRFHPIGSRSQRLTFDIDHTRSVIIDENRRDDTGPDLAFLTLPQETIGALSARSSFFNLGKRRPINDKMLEGPLCSDCAMGMVDERTASLEPKYGNPNRVQFTAFAINGRASLIQEEPHDLLRLDPNDPVGDPNSEFCWSQWWRAVARIL